MISDLLKDFEYGRLLACKGEKAQAREHLELVMSGMSLLLCLARTPV